MVDKIIELSILSGGLLPLMGLVLLITLAVIIERCYFFHFIASFGMVLERDLKTIKPGEKEKLSQLEKHYNSALQLSVVTSALACNQNDEQGLERHMDEAILWQIPKLEKNIWILDTSVTLAPLMGLLGTIIGMVHAFDILGVSGASGSATEMISGGIAEALVATGAGILIAIIAVVFLNHFNKKIQTLLNQMELLKVMMKNRLINIK